MAQKPISREDAQRAVDTFYECGGVATEAARALGIPRGTLRNRLYYAKNKGIIPVTTPIAGEFSSGKSFEERAGRLDIADSGKWLIASDIHVPFHSEAATDAAFDDALKIGVRGIILNGDIMDFHAFSSFPRDPEHRLGISEIERGREFLAAIRKAFPRARIIYNEGNHEARIVSYLMKFAPELYGLSELSLPNLLNMGGNGIQFVDSLSPIMLGKLCIVHGHEYRIGAGVVNVARILQQRAGINAMCGHFHRTNEYIKRMADGTVQGAWSVGCLSGLSPRWLPMNEWNHGYAIVELDEDGSFEVHNHTIIRGKRR